MKFEMKKTMIAAALSLFVVTSALAQNTPSLDEMWRVIQQQKVEIENLKQQLNATSKDIKETRVIAMSTADAIEDGPIATGSVAASWTEKTRFGGYGELLFNSGTQTSDDTTSNPNKEVDVQRFVTYFAHDFNDQLRFFSELEVEHSNTGGAGEVELEQAYIEWDYSPNHRVLAGLYLAPLGILNETHEPNTFYGVERNRIESRIIPSTYRVNGIKFSGKLAEGISYDLGIHEGLQLADNFSIRSSRQGGSRANFEDPAVTARFKYMGVPALELGVAFQYQSDLAQSGIGNSRLGRSEFDANGSVSALLTELHAVYQPETGFGLRALYARWDIDDEIVALGGVGRDEQEGWYIEPSYRFNDKIGIFARQEYLDERAGNNDNQGQENRTLLGINYWLTPNVVLKGDIQFEDDEGRTAELDGFNLGAGWNF